VTNADEQSFLTAILAAPDDDTPRLVLADWLDERGTADDKARAALIRAQCQAEYLPPGGKERKRLEVEAKSLVKANEKNWLKDIRAKKLGSDYRFRRGFLDSLSMSPTTFVKRGDELFAVAPTIRTVKFPNAANEVTELAASPYLAQLVSVDLTRMCTCGYCGIGEELRDLFKSKHASNLRSLNISRDRIDVDGIAALTRSANLANLTELDLTDNPLESAGVAALAKSKHLGKLRSLVLTNVALPPTDGGLAALTALLGSKHFRSLTHLNLGRNHINADGVRAVVASPLFARLTHLDLSHNRIGEQGAKALTNADASKLESLDLSGMGLGVRARLWLATTFGKKVKV